MDFSLTIYTYLLNRLRAVPRQGVPVVPSAVPPPILAEPELELASNLECFLRSWCVFTMISDHVRLSISIIVMFPFVSRQKLLEELKKNDSLAGKVSFVFQILGP